MQVRRVKTAPISKHHRTMKNHKLKGLTLSFLFVATLAQAQQESIRVNEPDQHKPTMFSQMPDRIPMSVLELSTLILNNPETGREVAVKAEGKQLPMFTGRVVSAAAKFGNTMRSVVVRLNAFSGATFSLTATRQEDGSIQYAGRIISFQHADLYELEQDGTQYQLVKKNFFDVVNE